MSRRNPPSAKEEDQFKWNMEVFKQSEEANYVACSFLDWFKQPSTNFVFERIEPHLQATGRLCNPDMAGSHKRRDSGLIVEIKSTRSVTRIAQEGNDLRSQLESYLNAKEKWPTQAEGASRNVGSVDVVFVCHFESADAYLKEIQESKKLLDALKVNFAMLVWEQVEARDDDVIRIRWRTGTLRDVSALEKFRSFNGFQVAMKRLMTLKETYSVRLKIQCLEHLLVLVTAKALSVTDPSVLLPKGLVVAESPAYFDKDVMFLLPDALLDYINTVDDLSKQRYFAKVERRHLRFALDLLVELGVFRKRVGTSYYSIRTSMRHREIAEYVLRLYARYQIDVQQKEFPGPTEKAEEYETLFGVRLRRPSSSAL
jgi:hypothetical protein